MQFHWNFLLFRNCHCFFGLGKTENMTGCKNDTIQHRNQKISSLIAAVSQLRNQRQRNDVDNPNGDHRTDRTKRIDLRTFFNILCHRTAQRSIGNIDTSITQNQNAVGHGHIDDLCRIAPIWMCPERDHQHNCSQWSSDQQPGTISSPACICPVGQTSNNRIIDRIPKSGKSIKEATALMLIPNISV